MARKQSVILTPAEKKAAVGTAKDAVKNAKHKLADCKLARKTLDSEYSKAVKASDKDIAAAAQAYFKPEQLTWVVVGDLSKIEAGVRALNIGEVKVLDADGKAIR